MSEQVSLFQREKTKFTDGEFMSSKDKEKALKTLKRIITNRDIGYLDNNLYRHLMNHCGFIAHYDIQGFKGAYSGLQGLVNLLKDLKRNHIIYGDYKDINKVILEYANANINSIENELELKEQHKEITLLKELAKKHGVKIQFQ